MLPRATSVTCFFLAIDRRLRSWVASGKPICQLLRCSGLTLTHQNAWLLAVDGCWVCWKGHHGPPSIGPESIHFKVDKIHDKIHMSNFVWSYRKHDQTWTYYKNQKQFETTAKRSHGHHWKPTNGPSACRMVRVQTRIDFLLQDIMVTSITGLSVHISKEFQRKSSNLQNAQPAPILLPTSFVGTANDFPALEWRHGSLSSKQFRVCLLGKST